MTGAIAFGFFCVLLSCGLWALLVRDYRKRLGGTPWRFQFQLSDLWAMAASMIPSHAAAASAFSDPDKTVEPLALSVAFCMALSQLAGAYMGMLNREYHRAQKSLSWWEARGYIAAGSLWGLFVMVLPALGAGALAAPFFR